ncbi:hypothetical protein PNEG_03107 [Pneumocystis murina B123]|uniref:Uncharacterized protein n=1 Tax=Pneumocystis murina (strain B123) TaxID=1069680 RepID=M7NND6_PNEMU|nr:hypothetical protein PNEG_03107 [Pneumocystis murina B123]EMR08631.1 hypothetical protein PNEG_03107 [Pneumocystis murina B123]
MENIQEVPNEQELETWEEKELYMIEMLHSLTLKVKVKKMEAKLYRKREFDLQHYLSNTPCEDLSQCEWQLSLLKLMKLRQKNDQICQEIKWYQGQIDTWKAELSDLRLHKLKSRGFMQWLKHLSDKSPFMCRKYRSQTELPGITGI